jgi:ketosteroid isomerase-like protein
VTDADLQRQMDEFQRCIELRDADAAESVLHESYALVLVHPSPAVMARARWLEVLADYVVDEYDLHERTVDIDGDVACVLQRVSMRATVLGEDRSGTFVISDVWLRDPSGWRVWRRHSTPLAAGRMPGA